MVQGAEAPSLSLHTELGAVLPRLRPRTPGFHVTRPPLSGRALSLTRVPGWPPPAVVAPRWPGSALLPSPSSLAGLAHRGGSFISLQTCFSLFRLVYQERVFLEPLFPSQTVGERCLVCVSSQLRGQPGAQASSLCSLEAGMVSP